MPTTTNFEEWFDASQPNGPSDEYSLYSAAGGVELDGVYKVWTDTNGQRFIRERDSDLTLMLTTPAAITAFENWVRYQMYGNESPEGMYYMAQQADKDD